MEPLRVTCVVPYALGTAPSQRFRWEQWDPYLAEEGVSLRFVPFETPDLHRARRAGRPSESMLRTLTRVPGWLGALRRSRDSDLVVVHRNAALAGPPLAETWLRSLRVPLVYDFDDAIHLPPEDPASFVRRLTRADWRVAAVCRMADLVSVGNPLLAEYARWYCEATTVWPTTVSLRDYVPRPAPSPAAVPTIGWSGSRTTQKYLEPLLPLLRKLRQSRAFRVLVIGAEVDLTGLDGECLPWEADKELERFHRMDIGLMPLPDTAWTRGKCALKGLQYLACGVPAVVSDTGVNKEAIPEGVGGHVVRTEQDWLAALIRLLDDPARRDELGRGGRRHVERNFSAEAWAPRIADALRSLPRRPVLGGGPRAGGGGPEALFEPRELRRSSPELNGQAGHGSPPPN